MEQKKPAAKESKKPTTFKYYYSSYVNGGTFIAAYDDSGNETVFTICLISYGILPDANEVIVPAYKLSDEEYQSFKNVLVKREIRKINYGPFDAYGVWVELVDNWRDLCHPLDEE